MSSGKDARRAREARRLIALDKALGLKPLAKTLRRLKDADTRNHARHRPKGQRSKMKGQQ